MLPTLQVVAVMLVALCMALSVAHALEYPGKMRLDEQTYRAVQRIYYPGFTIGGGTEPLAILATAAVALLTPRGGPAFWLALLALVAIALMHAVFWLVVQPVNKAWMKGQPTAAPATVFFRTGGEGAGDDWTVLRNRWEIGHIVRAVLATVSLLALASSLVV